MKTKAKVGAFQGEEEVEVRAEAAAGVGAEAAAGVGAEAAADRGDAAPSDTAVTDAAPSDTAVTDAAPSDTAVTDAAPSDGAVNDPVFEAEQAHLTYTYAKLEKMARDAMVAMEAVANQAAHDKKTMSEELAVNFATWDDILETQAEIQAMNNIIEAHNMANSVQAERLRAVEVLLRCPYFAKIEVEFRKGQPLKELYIGSAGVSDENYKRLVVDWRSPVAEVYYNQSMGPTTYEADGRTIHVDLKLRRQFEIKRDQLLSYFDSDVAIEDKLLLASLAQGRSAHMKAITATIQREQNAVIRHADVPVLQVSGVAGSGKTSVLMQRIAYLFYQHRGSLDPNQVFLISPNPVFGRYIDKVLPDLGERNPEILTWEEFLAPLLPEGRGVGEGDVTFEQLERISKAVEHFEFDRLDFASIECEEVTFVSRETILKIAEKFGHLPAGPHRVTLMGEEITARVTERMKNLAANEDVHDEISGLPLNEQLNLFGEVFDPQDEIEARRLALTYIESKYAAAVRAAKRMEWLDVDHVAQRLMGRHGLTSVEWVYLKMALTGLGNPEAKYVMIDEVQDYSEGKLAVLARYFRRAHFLLLGDPNQAIFEKTASWAEARAVFERERGQVEQCSLMTSYRSTPAITDLFARLLPPEEALQVSSVQRESAAPRLLECKTPDEWLETLQEEVRRAAAPGTLVAVVVPWKNDAARLGKQLEGVTVIGEGNSLPAEGVVVLPLKLAKGLEFDYVIVPDVSERVFPESDIARRRLYTTLSRATRHVTLISRGALTPLLK